MQKIKQLLSLVITFALILTTFTSCNSDVASKLSYNNNDTMSIGSDVIAKNQNYELSWNDESKFVLLKDLKSGKIWSTIPYDYYLSGGMSANVNSTFNITVSNTKSLKWDTVNGYTEAFTDGRITSKKIKDGIKITYYFDKFKISVPVIYKLTNNCLDVYINPKTICEKNDYKLVAINPAPFLCSSKNSDLDSYLFVPTGSGAIMYTDERADGDRVYSGEVYGGDFSRLTTDISLDDEPIKMPVFGVKDNNEALFAIIKEGAECAKIEALAGNNRTGYSNISANFYLRSFDKEHSGVQSLNFEDIIKISDNMSVSPIIVSYYPLSGAKADYIGMAECYKNYLGKNTTKNSNNNSASIGLSIYGGTSIDSSFLGIHKIKTDSLTTFSEVSDIIKKLSKNTSLKFDIILRGFGDSGINIGKIAGGYSFSDVLGNKQSHLELENLCKDLGFNLYTDFELLRYNKSGNGFNLTFDSAKSPSLQTVNKTINQIPYVTNENNKYRLIKREQISTAVEKLIKFANKNKVSGIGISSLSSISYSDYSDKKYYACDNISKDIQTNMKSILKSNHNIAASNANDYAAIIANTLYDSPVSNGDYTVFDWDLPFYEMVFGGAKPIYANSINTSSNIQKQIMLTLSSGARICFDLTNSLDTNDLLIQTERLYSSVFSNNYEEILNIINKYYDISNATAGKEIIDYEIIDKNISKTVFKGGITIYANHIGENVSTIVGDFKPYDIQLKNG